MSAILAIALHSMKIECVSGRQTQSGVLRQRRATALVAAVVQNPGVLGFEGRPIRKNRPPEGGRRFRMVAGASNFGMYDLGAISLRLRGAHPSTAIAPATVAPSPGAAGMRARMGRGSGGRLASGACDD
jgi:hypothetical protein